MAFCENVRNGIIHGAETRKAWFIGMAPQNRVIEQDSSGNYVLNRTMFHQALKQAFSDWITELRRGDAALREKMRNRMDEIVARHYSP